MKIQIAPGVFSAVNLFAAKSDVRYWLNGMLIDCSIGGVYLVATDGHAIAAARIDSTPYPDRQYILAGSVCDIVAKNKRNPITLTLADGLLCLDNIQGIEVDGRYPDWRRVIKCRPSAELAFFDPKFHARVESAAQMIQGKRKNPAFIRPGGSGVGYAQIDADGEVGAWVMPMRQDIDAMPTHPVWSSPA